MSRQSNWGNIGRDKVQELLAGLAETEELLQDADNDAEVDLGQAKVGRKPIRRLFMFDRPKKPQVSTSTALDVALELRLSIGCGYNQKSCMTSTTVEMNQRMVPPRQSGKFSRSVHVRTGAIAFIRRVKDQRNTAN